VIPQEYLYAMLDQLRREVIEAVENPAEDKQTEFGFGKLSGSLSILTELRARMEAYVEESDRRANQQED
jgi:hypothetical protein